MLSTAGHLGEVVVRHAKRMATEFVLGRSGLKPPVTVLRVQLSGKPRCVGGPAAQEIARWVFSSFAGPQFSDLSRN